MTSYTNAFIVPPSETTRPSDWWHQGKKTITVPQSVYPIPANDLAASIPFQPSHGYTAGVALSELLDHRRGIKDPKKFMLVDTTDRQYMMLYIQWPGEPKPFIRNITVYDPVHGRRRVIQVAIEIAKAYEDLFKELRGKYYPPHAYGSDWTFAQDVDRLRLDRIYTREGFYWYADVSVVLDC